MLGFTLMSDSFFGPRGSSALACQQPHTFQASLITHRSSTVQLRHDVRPLHNRMDAPEAARGGCIDVRALNRYMGVAGEELTR